MNISPPHTHILQHTNTSLSFPTQNNYGGLPKGLTTEGCVADVVENVSARENQYIYLRVAAGCILWRNRIGLYLAWKKTRLIASLDGRLGWETGGRLDLRLQQKISENLQNFRGAKKGWNKTGGGQERPGKRLARDCEGLEGDWTDWLTDWLEVKRPRAVHAVSDGAKG